MNIKGKLSGGRLKGSKPLVTQSATYWSQSAITPHYPHGFLLKSLKMTRPILL